MLVAVTFFNQSFNNAVQAAILFGFEHHGDPLPRRNPQHRLEAGLPADSLPDVGVAILAASQGTDRIVQVNGEDLIACQQLVRRMPVGESVVEAILELVRSARPGETDDELDGLIAWGPGPRASQALMLTVRARALVDGRLAPSVDDVLALAEPVLQHRMALTFAARADGHTIRSLIGRVKSRIG